MPKPLPVVGMLVTWDTNIEHDMYKHVINDIFVNVYGKENLRIFDVCETVAGIIVGLERDGRPVCQPRNTNGRPTIAHFDWQFLVPQAH